MTAPSGPHYLCIPSLPRPALVCSYLGTCPRWCPCITFCVSQVWPSISAPHPGLHPALHVSLPCLLPAPAYRYPSPSPLCDSVHPSSPSSTITAWKWRAGGALRPKHRHPLSSFWEMCSPHWREPPGPGHALHGLWGLKTPWRLVVGPKAQPPGFSMDQLCGVKPSQQWKCSVPAVGTPGMSLLPICLEKAFKYFRDY